MSEQGEYWIVKSDNQKAAAAAHLATLPVSLEKPYSIKIEPYRHVRRLAQNRLLHMWCSETSKQGHEYTPENTYRPHGEGTRFCRECGRIENQKYYKKFYENRAAQLAVK